MLFNSFEFLIFFPLVTILFFLLPHKFRWILLLTASCIFYMFFIPAYILILVVTIVIDYFAGIWIEKTEGKKRKIYLVISIISTCMVLFIFKYFNFFNTNIALLAEFLHWNYPIGVLEIILPIGLSFHTFQSLSYVIEVYRRKQKAEYNFGIYSLYVMFYPQLVAGPIERPQNLIHQFYENHKFDYHRVTNGLKLMAWGLFKKVVIADRIAVIVNSVYNNPNDYEGLPLIIATIFFAFQIFCDFSGYSDIAIGAAQVMGFKLMKNFDRPYFSKSISEFWKRWHISLSTWFKDYLYISLGGSRVNSKWRWYYNLFITFLISGLWHGAKWNFVIWGALNGFYLVFAIITEKYRNKVNDLIGLNYFPNLKNIILVLTTFSLTCFAWIFFRADDLNDSFYIIRNLFTNLDLFNIDTLKNYVSGTFIFKTFGVSRLDFIIGVLCILFMEFIHFLQRKHSIIKLVSHKPVWVRWSLYVSFILLIVILSDTNQYQFIYFQF